MIKTKRILKELSRKVSDFFVYVYWNARNYVFQETIDVLRQADMRPDTKKAGPQKDYGVLNRFLPKSNRRTSK